MIDCTKFSPSKTNDENSNKNFRMPEELPIIELTPSQEFLITNFIQLLPEFKILVIKGESGSGKYTAVNEGFKRINAIVENFDLCELAEKTKSSVSNQHVVEYLDILLSKLEARMNDKKRKRNDSDLDNYRKIPGIIYFRYYNRIADTLCDCYAKHRYLLPLILKTFSEKMPKDVRIVITTHGCMLPEGLHWCLDLITSRKDMEHIMCPYINNNKITPYEAEQIMKLSKIIPIGRLLYCIKYASAISPKISDKLDRGDSFLLSYRKALSKFSGSTVDIERDVPNPIPEDDLIGVDDIIDEIITSIINPMKLGIPGIPIKKGLLLCGPPGTGKTSIGRWLAHQIKGKFYLIGGEVGINGSSLIDIFDITVRRARENAPAVIFIDDCDVLFDHDDTYRAFLTILDGIETNKRNDICVILTCMNLRNVPSSLLRGGRLEMALVTRLPDRDKIRTILNRSLDKMVQTIKNYNIDLSNEIVKFITYDFISNLSIKMTGWNCADIHRCVNDVSRLIVANKGTNINDFFEKCIKQIKDQYSLCGKCESTNLDENNHYSYIS